jgi:hypothetical protein
MTKMPPDLQFCRKITVYNAKMHGGLAFRDEPDVRVGLCNRNEVGSDSSPAKYMLLFEPPSIWVSNHKFSRILKLLPYFGPIWRPGLEECPRALQQILEEVTVDCLDRQSLRKSFRKSLHDRNQYQAFKFARRV